MSTTTNSFVPLTERTSYLYIFVPVTSWDPETVLNPANKFYANCNDLEKQAMYKVNDSLGEGTVYPKYQGIFDPKLISVNYIFGSKKVDFALLTGNNFPTNFLAKKDIYIVTDEDKQLAREFIVKNLSFKDYKKWSEIDKFNYALINVTNKQRGARGI